MGKKVCHQLSGSPAGAKSVSENGRPKKSLPSAIRIPRRGEIRIRKWTSQKKFAISYQDPPQGRNPYQKMDVPKKVCHQLSGSPAGAKSVSENGRPKKSLPSAIRIPM